MGEPFHYVAIPCENFDRAFAFYSAITNNRLQKNPNVPFPMAYFLGPNGEYTSHLFQLTNFLPSLQGPLVYFKLHDDLNETLALIEANGGKTILPKTLLAPGKGYWAIFLDCEGNRLALHGDQ